MSSKAMLAVFNLPVDADLTSEERLVLIALSENCDDDGNVRSLRTDEDFEGLARIAGMTVEKFKQVLKSLLYKEWIGRTFAVEEYEPDYIMPFVRDYELKVSWGIGKEKEE
ncbi:MAG: hypothetical protein DRN20_04975 [Thermoplasmata archaeon]|nr:MAG: hypothetical protein DRN20_04975 [Thermoplasmata archaeon]